jgi:hypothetical protein
MPSTNESELLHLGLIKMRAVGTGSCGLSLTTFDNLNELTIPAVPLQATNQFLIQRLANYIAQGIIFQGAAVNLNDSIRVTDITLFLKPIYTEIPM